MLINSPNNLLGKIVITYRIVISITNFILIISLAIVFAIGFYVIPSAYAENTISVNSLKQFYDFDDEIYVSGHVNFKNDQAIGLGIGPGYSATIHVYDDKRDRLLFTSSQSLDDDNTFSFVIPPGKFKEKDRYSISIFYGPPKENFRNTSFAGSADLFVGISVSEYKKQIEEKQRQIEEQQRQATLAESQKTTPKNTFKSNDNSWIIVIIGIVIGFAIMMKFRRKNNDSRHYRPHRHEYYDDDDDDDYDDDDYDDDDYDDDDYDDDDEFYDDDDIKEFERFKRRI